MDILILGGAGMLGHKLFQRLRQSQLDTACTIRGTVADSALRNVCLFRSGGVVENFDATDFSSVDRLLSANKPRVVINCIGVIKQRALAKEPVPTIEINACFPHRLAQSCEQIGARLIHFSTDCVFSGRRGHYVEADISDAEDLYGRSKFLGEVSCGRALTLRTSIVGREIAHYESLLEWFLRQNAKRISGFTRAMYSGVTTNYLARVVECLISAHPTLAGLYQVAGTAISKFDLLGLLRDAYQLNIEIIPEASFCCDRTMKGDKFARATGLVAPAWPTLVSELVNDETPYERWK
jgi:dTDP-4-dehydrorhamnose reductase